MAGREEMPQSLDIRRQFSGHLRLSAVQDLRNSRSLQTGLETGETERTTFLSAL